MTKWLLLLDKFMFKTTQLWFYLTSLRYIIALGCIIGGIFVGMMQNVKRLADKMRIIFMFYWFSMQNSVEHKK